METLILDLRRQHPAWGARKLRRRLHDLGHQGLPSPSTITEILRRHHLLEPQHPSAQGPWQRFTHAYSNDLWQMDQLGVDLIHGRPFHPQTQGKDERFHRTLKAELLDRSLPWTSLAACQTDFTTFRSIYNLQRPHHSLNLDVPAAHYRPSHRSFPASLSLPEYLPGDLIRTVKSKGEIIFQNHFFYVGGAFAGLPSPSGPRPSTTASFPSTSLGNAWVPSISIPPSKPSSATTPLTLLTPLLLFNLLMMCPNTR